MALETLRYFWHAHGKSVQRVLTATKLTCTYTCGRCCARGGHSPHLARTWRFLGPPGCLPASPSCGDAAGTARARRTHRCPASRDGGSRVECNARLRVRPLCAPRTRVSGGSWRYRAECSSTCAPRAAHGRAARRGKHRAVKRGRGT